MFGCLLGLGLIDLVRVLDHLPDEEEQARGGGGVIFNENTPQKHTATP